MFNRKLAKFLRNQKGLTQTQLAELCDVHPVTISNWERGEKQPDANNIQALAQALGTTTDDLMTSDEYNAARAKQMTTENKKAPTDVAGEGDGTRRKISMEDWIRVPIVSREWTACCGNGISAAEITNMDEGFVLVDRAKFYRFDDMRRPFAIWCDGDCLESAGIKDGYLAVINPAEEVMPGAIALVSLGNSLSLKRVNFMPNGDVVLRSDHGPRRITPEEMDRDEFAVLGVLADVHQGRPKALPL